MDDASHLAAELERLSQSAIERLLAFLSIPIDTENPGLMRAQTTSAAIALNTQLRADALRLRAQRSDKALEELIRTLRAQECKVPSVPMALLAD